MDLADLYYSIDFLGVAGTILKITYIICIVALFICKAIGVYFLSLRTKQKHAWMAFVPILQDMKVFNMAGLSSKVYVIFYCVYRALLSAQLEWGIFAPIWWIGIAVYAIGLLYARYQMAKNFGGSQAVCILNAIFEPIMVLYIFYKKFTHQYTPQYAKVDTYLKAYGLYEDPATFEDPNARPEPTFGKAKQQAQPQAQQQYQQQYQQPQSDWYQNTTPYQNANPTPIQINTEKEENTINLNTEK